MSGLPTTIELAFYSILFAIFLGVSSGLLASLYPGKLLDVIPMSISLLGICIPSIILGPVLVLIFGIWYEIFPVYGWGDNPGDKILPTITLGTAYAAIFARLTRGGMLEVLGQDFIRTARAKGLSQRQAIWRHALKNALIPVLTIIGMQFSFLMAGAIIIENVFFLPGLGRLIFQGITQRDLIVVESVVMLLVFAVIIVTFIVDLTYAAVDPRLRKR